MDLEARVSTWLTYYDRVLGRDGLLTMLGHINGGGSFKRFASKMQVFWPAFVNRF